MFDVTILENIVKDVKTSDMLNEIEQLISEMTDIVDKIRQNRETNSSVVREQKKNIENEIRELRTKINNNLDKLQEDLMKELTEAEKQITDETRDLMVYLDEKQKELSEHQTNIVNIKKHASDLQAYIAVKQIEKDIETQDTCLQLKVNSLKQTKISYRIETGLKTITSSIQKFGEVFVESKPCELTIARKKDKQAQMMVADLSPPMLVDNIQLKLKQKINIKGSWIRGCSFLPDGRMVLSCYNTNTVSFMNKEGVEYFQICEDKTESCTYDTVYIKDNNSVAVSSGRGNSKCITIIDLESREIMTTISMETLIFGMVVRGRTIYYCAWDEGLKMLNLSDKTVSDVISSDMSGIYYVATSGDKLYYTNDHTHSVTCCDLHGTTQWKFKDECVLRGPRGISVDNDGNVYVAGRSSNNVVVFSPDGESYRQVLSPEDGPLQPTVLDFDKYTNRLLVVNESESAFLLDVTVGE
jgi:DNA-binding beta-propeller fold protein YncE